MSIYAISDLHLCLSNTEKSMETFGTKWKGYIEKISENWKETVKEEDTVIIPGDISWALKLEEAYEDFKYINDLPGTKIILKGNHDFYFTTVAKVEQFFKLNHFDTIKILSTNSYFIDGYNICGSRMWGTTERENTDDNKIHKREYIRLKLSLDSISNENKDKPIIVATHFPPFRHEVMKLLQTYNVKKCVYGHLHGDGHYMVKQGVMDDVEYIMVSGDYTDFKLIKLD